MAVPSPLPARAEASREGVVAVPIAGLTSQYYRAPPLPTPTPIPVRAEASREGMVTVPLAGLDSRYYRAPPLPTPYPRAPTRPGRGW